MELGIHFIDFTLPGEPESLHRIVADAARAAEAVGCRRFSVMDHWFQMEFFRTAHDPMLEAYTTLGYLAGVTSSIELTALVTGVTYRHPGLLAKIVTTLDVLSNGRALLGIGAAWYDREHLGLGVPYPDLTERFERLEETLQICLQMWSDDDGPFEGAHYQLAETICQPRPVSSPRPRIMIGGKGERKTLRLVAEYGDVSNFVATTPEETKIKLAVLERHLADVDRDPREIERTIAGSTMATDDPDAFLAEMERFARLGISLVEVTPLGDDPVAFIEQFGSYVMPRLAEIG